VENLYRWIDAIITLLVGWYYEWLAYQDRILVRFRIIKFIDINIDI
jgi:hypothetical protein